MQVIRAGICSGLLLGVLAMPSLVRCAQTTAPPPKLPFKAPPPRPAQRSTPQPQAPVPQRPAGQPAPVPQRPAGQPAPVRTGARPVPGASPQPQVRAGAVGAGTTARQPMAETPRTLTPVEAAQAAGRFQGQRAHLSGVNHAALPTGRWSENPDHTVALAGNNGRSYLLRPTGTVMSYQNNGKHALLDAGGRVQALQMQDLRINRGTLGVHQVQAVQPGGGSVVSFGAHRGYVERPVVDRGRTLMQRVELSHGNTSTHMYRSFAYRNVPMAAYVPDVYYGPGFYGWLNVGWSTPVAYQWGWSSGSAPAYYMGYYAPQPTYTSPNQWVTDYVLTADLDEAYTGGLGGGETAGQPTALGMAEDLPPLASTANAPITPQLKAQVGAQVARGMALDRAESAQVAADPAHGAPIRQDVAAGLDPAVQMFLVANTMQVLAGRQQCQLREGDILFLPQPAQNGAASADLVVKSSLKGDCPGEVHVSVAVHDLQEMSNHFREHITSAEETLASRGSGAQLPPPPEARPLYPMQDVKATPEQSADALTQIQLLQTRATREESSVQQEMSASGGTQ